MLSKLETKGAESALFFRHWLRHPLEIGAFLPSSAAVGCAMAKAVAFGRPGMILELGGSEVARVWSQFPPVQVWRYQRWRGAA
jgi:phospholipid N-methyltransferase